MTTLDHTCGGGNVLPPDEQASLVRQNIEALLADLGRVPSVEVPPGCPRRLRRRIARHNADVRCWLAARRQWTLRTAGWPVRAAAADVPAMLCDYRDLMLETTLVFADHERLLKAAGDVLGVVVAVLGDRAATAGDGPDRRRARATAEEARTRMTGIGADVRAVEAAKQTIVEPMRRFLRADFEITPGAAGQDP